MWSCKQFDVLTGFIVNAIYLNNKRYEYDRKLIADRERKLQELLQNVLKEKY